MKRIIVILTAIILLSCTSQIPVKNNSKLFTDCIDNSHKPRCCLSFEMDSTFARSKNVYGGTWDTDQGYTFISKKDTISMAIYFNRTLQDQSSAFPGDLLEGKKMYGQKLYLDYKCSIQEYIPLDAFFKGNYASCIGGYSEILTYRGYYYDAAAEYEVGIYIDFNGPKITKEREADFKHIIETIKVTLEPR